MPQKSASKSVPITAAIPRRKLADEVLERLLHLIESGAYGPGDQLPSEREMMNLFVVGRPAVREALQSLQQMGMITINHGERAKVVSVTPASMFEQIARSARHLLATSPRSLEDLKEARLMFELGMVHIAVSKAGPADIDRLRADVASLEAARGHPAAIVRADIAFHETIAAISGNPIFTAISRAMLEWLADFHVELVRQPGREDLTIIEHRQILDRIAAADADGARQAMADHLNRANALYRTR
ncbi:MAG TPA: transcriptional regulator NanR [Bryobacteraceae bacterium]|nr:transcriptional regulator NanR [Bryobacteraceae bacterium]